MSADVWACCCAGWTATCREHDLTRYPGMRRGETRQAGGRDPQALRYYERRGRFPQPGRPGNDTWVSLRFAVLKRPLGWQR